VSNVTRKIIDTGSLLVVAALISNVVITYVNIQTLIKSNRWVEHTRETTAELERTLSAVKDAETGQRGYLLTGDESYLDPYRAAPIELERSLRRLAELTSDNPGQRARLVELKRLAGEKLEHVKQAMIARRDKGLGTALEIVNSGVGRQTMLQIRRDVDGMRDEENRLLDQRSAASQVAVHRTMASFIVASVFALSLLFLVSFLRQRDERERERAAETLRKSEAWLATTLSSIGDAVITTDGNARVLFINPVARMLTGWSEDEAIGRPMDEVFQIVEESTLQLAESPVLRVIREGIVLGLANHSVLINRSGQGIPIDDSAAPIKDEQGRVVGVVLVFRDITERRRQETERERMLAAERVARSEVEEANRAKDHFLAVLSHELRTPLNPILLATTAMLDRPVPADQIRPTLQMIRQNVMLQARLIDDLLDVMRIVRGKMALHWGSADCHDLIRHAVAVCRSEILGKVLKLTLDLSAEHSHVNADSARLQQVLWNLIKNAVKFTPEGGAITIRTHNQDADQLVIEVSDTGIGIERELLPLIFDPFQQGESDITRKYGGLGLGLAISRGIIDAHGGTLAAESEGTDRGATLRIVLRHIADPVDGKLGKSRDPSNAASLPIDPLNILVVEDEQTTLKLMEKLLKSLGHQVTLANTLASAWEVFQENGFDLIISDLGLPDGSGLELMRRVSTHRPLPAIALTGYGMEEDIDRSRAAGFTSHMTKPIDFMKLEAMIRQITR
jgi:PAS domain S-box-containing protein